MKYKKVIETVKVLLTSLAVYYGSGTGTADLFWLIVLAVGCVYYVLDKAGADPKNRKEIAACVLAGGYASGSLTLGLRYWEGAEHTIPVWLTVFAGLAVLFYCGFSFVLAKAKGLHLKGYHIQTAFLTGRRRILLTGVLFFIAWIPMLIANYPGIMMYDSKEQWLQACGEWSLSNHHPIWHTMLIRFSQFLCRLFCTELIPEYGVLIYSLLQMLIMAAVFACVTEGIYRAGTTRLFWVGSILYYALFPLHAISSVSMVKDSLFGAAVLLYTLEIYQLYVSEGEWGRKNGNILIMTLTMLGVLFFRNNGIAVIALTGPVMFLLYRKLRVRILVMGVVAASCFLLQNTVLFDSLNIRQTSLAEAIGMPINQIANIVSHDRALSEKETEMIEAVMPLSSIRENYSVRYSDPIKFSEDFRGYVIEASKPGYFKLWLGLLLRYPADCIEASLNLTVGFWYPGVEKGAVSVVTSEKDTYLKEIGVETDKLSTRSTIFDVFLGEGIRNNPLFSGFWSIGNMVLVMLLLCLLCMLLGKGSAIQVFLPCMGVWLTLLIASPSYCETRYIYSVFAAMPVFAALTGRLMIKENRE